MAGDAQLDWEVGIEWARDDALDFEFVRRKVIGTRTLNGPPPEYRTFGTVVGWANLHDDTPYVGHHWQGFRWRRYFWLRPSDAPLGGDAFTSKFPAEAVDPRSVAPGVPADPLSAIGRAGR